MDSVVQLAAIVRSTTGRSRGIPWPVATMLVGSTSIIVGLLWDISWHMTIGRDSFWTPAHMAIYLGGVLAGIACGFLALKTTFAGSEEERGSTVRFWGFRAPLGAWVAVWGSFAMLTSAPFDDWWHNAYGLDVEILSPPHAVLAAGMIAIQIGTMLMLLARQNRAEGSRVRGLGLAHLYSAGIVLLMVATMLTEYSYPNNQHAALFYQVSCAVFPLFLVAIARSSRLRWAATRMAGFYMLIALAMAWILPLFKAQPMLGPINNPVDHMVPPLFPLLLFVPALAIDYLLQRYPEKRGGWGGALAIAFGFLVLFFTAQWLHASFQLSPSADNWFTVGDRQWDYSSTTGPWNYEFWDVKQNPVTLRALGIALLLAFASTRIGLWWGSWMAKVQR
jgi:hypothetical protein